MNIVQFPGGRAAPAARPRPKKAGKAAPAFNVSLTKVAEAIQAVRFLEGDLPAAEELLAVFAKAVREGKREANVTTPLALSYSRYFSYADPEWEEAHGRMYSFCIGLT